MKSPLTFWCSLLLLAASSASIHAQAIWAVGLNDDGWPAGNGGGTNTSFVQENGTIQPLPGTPLSPETDQQADNDYYFAGTYTTAIPSVTALYGDYTPVGPVAANEEAAERAFAGGDNDLRYHFNLPNTLQATDRVSVSFDAFNLDTSGSDPRYGIEVYFNGVLVQSQIVIRPLQTGRTYTTPQFTLGSVNAQMGAGFDNIVSLKGISYSGDGGGSWMGFDYVQLNAPGDLIPAATYPWAVGKDDNGWPVGDGGGPNATFVQEAGTNPLPGSPTSPEVDQQADDDYYFAGLYTTVIAGNGAYTPVGLVPVNEEAAERAFSGTDNDLRYHFNLPNEVGPGDKVAISFDAFNLDDPSTVNTDPRYGVEIYFNGVLVQPEIVIRAAQLGHTFTTLPFTLGSVNAGFGSGPDNIVTLKGISHSAEGGGQWMGIDYVQLNPSTVEIPPPVLPWSVGLDDNAQPPGEGGGTNANFLGVDLASNPLPGSPLSDVFDGDADDDYYFAGAYSTLVEGNGTYIPVGLVSENELSTEKGFEGDDNTLRFHFNLPTSLTPASRLFFTFDALELQAATSPNYGVEVYFNGVLVQPEVAITPARVGQAISTPPFTLASVNARVGSGFDNIVTLRGINHSAQGGSSSVSFDYFRLTVLPTIVFPWSVGLDDNGWPVGDGGGPNATFVQEAGTNPLPGRPDNPEVNQQGDDDYYFAGEYTTAISSVVSAYGAYTPLGLVLANEETAERAFAGTDNTKRYHFNLPDSLHPNDQLQVSFDANNLDDPANAANTDLRYGVEIYFNGVLVQTQIVIRPAQLDVDYKSPPFTLASVNAQTGFGADNIITLQGINYNNEGGGNWMGIDYVKLDPYTEVIPPATFPWSVGKDDNGWPVGDGGGPNATFVQENGSANPLPGNPANPEANQQADDDYYFAGLYSTVIAGNGTYTPVGRVGVNEEAAERAFAGTDNDLRYHFNLPANLSPDDQVSISFDALNLDDPSAANTDPRYGVEVYFNGVRVQSEIVIRAAQLGQKFTTPSFSLGSVNAGFGSGFDNIVTLKGINHSAEGGGQWMGIDYVQLNPPIPAPTFPWAVGKNDDGWPVGDGGGPNATFVQENGTINALPGSPTSPEVNQQADNDYYFAGIYSTVIPGNGTYAPVGLVSRNEEAAERAFAGSDNDLRYHFNLPGNLAPNAKVSVSFDALNLDDSVGNTDPRYGIEVYFNGVRVQSEIVIRSAQLGQTFSTPAFTLGSVNAGFGSGFDNIVSLRGINHGAEGGGQWMGIDYVQLDVGSQDTTPPVIMCPNNMSIECGGSTPAIWQVSATDDVDGPVQVVCTPPSSAGLALGAHNVVCTASDAATNRATCSFTVTIADTVPPTLDVSVSSPIQVSHVCGQTVTIENAASGGAAVSYSATGSDACGTVQVICAPLSGSMFAPGVTTVTCTAVDTGGHSNVCSFTVTVRTDNTCPTAQARVVPPFTLAEDGHYLVISPNTLNAHVLFDASASSDADGDTLHFAWFEAPQPADNEEPVPPGKKKSKKKPAHSNDDDCVFGKVTQLTFQYTGNAATVVKVTLRAKKILFMDLVQPGEVFTVQGSGKDENISPEITVSTQNGTNVTFDTSGKTPIGPGLQTGDFLVISGLALKDNELCAVAPPPLTHRLRFGTNIVAERTLSLGVHSIELEVNDAACTNLATLVVEVITASDAVRTCILMTTDSSASRKDQRPLIETLNKALNDFNDEKFEQGVRKLEAFIKKVQKTKSLSPAEKDELSDCAQLIIDALSL